MISASFFSLEATIEHLVEFNLVRYFTLGLQQHINNRQAILTGQKDELERFSSHNYCLFFFFSALIVLGELFRIDGKQFNSIRIRSYLFVRLI
jgi:hypothetical protein